MFLHVLAVLIYFALKCKKKVFNPVFLSLFISHLFVYCVLFGIYCFALHPEHLGQHAGILGHKFSFPCPESCTFPVKAGPCMGCVLEPLLCRHAWHLLA